MANAKYESSSGENSLDPDRIIGVLNYYEGPCQSCSVSVGAHLIKQYSGEFEGVWICLTYDHSTELWEVLVGVWKKHFKEMKDAKKYLNDQLNWELRPNGWRQIAKRLTGE